MVAEFGQTSTAPTEEKPQDAKMARPEWVALKPERLVPVTKTPLANPIRIRHILCWLQDSQAHPNTWKRLLKSQRCRWREKPIPSRRHCWRRFPNKRRR